MNRLLWTAVALVALSACCQGHPDIEFPFGRIVNGVNTTIDKHPYQVSIQTIKSGSHFCGGSLIDSITVVTAAHCMQSYAASEIQVRLGSTYRNSGGEVVSVRAFKYHEGYNSTLMINDVAIIKLSTPVRQTSLIRAIELAKEEPVSGEKAVVSGWGTTCFLLCSSPNYLLEVEVELLHKRDCGSSTYNYGDSIGDTMVCAAGTDVKADACQGDSGGPLVSNGLLVGIVSWGNGCAWTGYPGVYASVSELWLWIVENSASL
ncbi:trypsin-like [Drosophila takahashii]|uniref:trypsin-like n=1 Tax=Drosophila takahashii TaxID=29030 RepID=UPI001CF8C6A7|nr:trypsin-like [Drosophila takahashii]